MLACAATNVVASSMPDLFDRHGGDGKAPATHEVISDHQRAGLSDEPLCQR